MMKPARHSENNFTATNAQHTLSLLEFILGAKDVAGEENEDLEVFKNNSRVPV